MSITMVAPSIGQQFTGLSQNYTADANGLIHNVAPQDVVPLLEAGCQYQTSGGSSSSVIPATPLAASATIPSTGGSFDLRLAAAGSFQLPTEPADGTEATFKDALQNCATYNATILPGSGDTIDLQSGLTMNKNGEELGLRYVLATRNWDIF